MDAGLVPPDGLGLTAEATSLRRPDLHEDSVYKMPPRLNCRGNFVEAQDMSSYPWVMQGASA